MYSTHRASLILTRLICVAFALFFLWDTIGHFQRGSFLHALAGSVLVCFFLLILFFLFRNAPPREDAPWEGTVREVAIHRKLDDSKPEGELVELMHANAPQQVALVRALLEANGVPAYVVGEHSARMLGFLPEARVRLLVRKEDLEKSLEIMTELPDGEVPEEET